MSDGPRYSNPGNSDDLYRWSDGRRNQQGQGQDEGDLFRWSDGRNNRQQGQVNENIDPFERDRMPGNIRENDYPERIEQQYRRADGTLIINRVFARNVYFDQRPEGGDYRFNPNQDFRNYDENCRRLQQRQQTSYYDNSDDRLSIPRQNDRRFYQDEMERERALMAAERARFQDQYSRNQSDHARYRSRDQDRYCQENGDYGNWRSREQDREQERRACEERLRVQIYINNSRDYNQGGRGRPYYGNDGCFGNGSYGRNDGYYGRGRDDDYYGRGHGGPDFGRPRVGVNVRIPIGDNGSSIRIGGRF